MMRQKSYSQSCVLGMAIACSGLFPWYCSEMKTITQNSESESVRKEKSKAKGSLEENIANLETKALTDPSPNVRKKCKVILHVAKYRLANGPVMQAKELGNVYTKKKNEVFGEKLKRCPKPSELLAALSPYLNVEKLLIKDRQPSSSKIALKT